MHSHATCPASSCDLVTLQDRAVACENFRMVIGESNWDILRLCVALVCRDALDDSDEDWEVLTRNLAYMGGQARELRTHHELALCVLSEFADVPTCQSVISRAKRLADSSPEFALREMTQEAVSIVDSTCPDQAFKFRVTLVLVSMLASSSDFDQFRRALARRPRVH